mmetsp:Transcript_83989/g.246321  ORF Transcript_83989/g.246321 Transcript_83989/m.246321 type:complete len:444 (+) Transcript_83989:958-2289(+)
MDSHDIHFVFFDWAFNYLHNFPHIQTAQGLTVFDTDARRYHRVFGNLHEYADEIYEFVLADVTLTVFIEVAKKRCKFFLGRDCFFGLGLLAVIFILIFLFCCLTIFALRFSSGFCLLRLPLAFCEKLKEVRLTDLVVLISINLCKCVFIRELFDSLMALDEGKGLLFQRIYFVGLLLPCILAEAHGEIGGPRQPGLVCAQAGLQLPDLESKPGLQVDISTRGDALQLLFGLGDCLPGFLHQFVGLVRQLEHLGRDHGSSFCREWRLPLDRGDLLTDGLYSFPCLTELLLQLGLELSKPLFVCFPCSLSLSIDDLLTCNSNRHLYLLEQNLLHALLPVFNQGLPHQVHCSLRNCEVKFSLRILENLFLIEHAILVNIVLVKDGSCFLHLLPCFSLLDGLVLQLLRRAYEAVNVPCALVDPLQELCHCLFGLGWRLSRNILDPHL